VYGFSLNQASLRLDAQRRVGARQPRDALYRLTACEVTNRQQSMFKNFFAAVQFNAISEVFPSFALKIVPESSKASAGWHRLQLLRSRPSLQWSASEGSSRYSANDPSNRAVAALSSIETAGLSADLFSQFLFRPCVREPNATFQWLSRAITVRGVVEEGRASSRVKRNSFSRPGASLKTWINSTLSPWPVCT
jgi:hypothetical protein